MKIQATFEIEDDRIETLFVSALEGGSNYWYWLNDDSISAVRNIVSRDEDPCYSTAIWTAIKRGAHVPIYDAEDYNADPLGTVTQESVKSALETMARDYTDHFNDLIGESDDAITGDIFFQLATMNEVVFG